MKIKKIVLLALISVSLNAFGQFEPTPTDETPTKQKAPKTNKQVKTNTPIKEKIIVGGGLDLQFGNITFVGVTPLLAYKVTDELMVGGIFTYRYFKNDLYIPSYSTSTYGVAPFARYTIFKGLFAHVEYEMLYGDFAINDNPFWVNSFFVGGGYGFPIGNNGFAGIYLLWNLTEDPNYILYSNPVVRMSFGIGL